MKKLAVALLTASAAVFGFGMVAEAYTTPVVTVTVDDPTPAPNQEVRVTMNGCEPGETVQFVLGSSTGTGVCNSSGVAQSLVTAPSSNGTFTGTSRGLSSGRTGTFTVTISGAVTPPTGLPATGGGGISTTTTVAIGLLVVGAGLFAVSQVRRRQASAPA